jgi:tetratricopeptide (TPR) repeat protein
MKSIFLLLLLLPFTNLFGQTTTRGGAAENISAASGKTHVILIGVSEYAFLPEDQQLDFADDDAQLFHDYLKTWGDIEFKLFLNQEAGKANVIGKALNITLLSEAQSGDKVIIFFAGHGDVEGEKGYLLLNQVKPKNNETYAWNDGALSLEKISEDIQAADKNGVEVTLIADACRSGSILSAEANKMMSGININTTTMISCQHNEFSEESIKYGNGHGVFTYYLIQGMLGLADSNKDLKISLLELQTYVQTNVVTEREGLQTPVFTGKLMKEIAPVNEKLLAKAEKQDNLLLAITALGKKKAVTAPFGEVSSRCQSLMQLLIEQTAANKFFNDELNDIDKLPFAVSEANVTKMYSSEITDIEYSKNKEYLAVVTEGNLFCFKSENLVNEYWSKQQIADITCMQFNHTSELIAAGCVDGNVYIYDPSSGERLKVFSKTKESITSVKFIYSNLLSIGTNNGKIYFFNIEDDRSETLKIGKGKVIAQDFYYPYLAVGTENGNCLVYNVESKEILFQFQSKQDIALLKYLSLTNDLLLVSSMGNIDKWSVKAKKLIRESIIPLESIADLVVDPFERYILIGTKDKKMTVIDLFNLQEQKDKSFKSNGVSSMSYDPKSYALLIGGIDGSFSEQKFKINPEFSAAIDVHSRLLLCSDVAKYRDQIDGTLIIGLNNQVSSVLNSLVNGYAKSPSIEEIRKTKRYATKALELSKFHDEDVEKLEINLLLLEIFEILKSSEKNNLQIGLEKINKIIELDPKGAYAYNIASQLYAAMEDLGMAKEMVANAERLAPKWSEPTCNYGKILFVEQNMSGAESKFRETISKSPGLSKGYYNLGKLYLSNNNLDSARVNLEKALMIDSGIVYAQELYDEVMRRLAIKNNVVKSPNSNSAQYTLESDKPLILNQHFYENFQNVLKLKNGNGKGIVVSGASYVKQKNKNDVVTGYLIRPFKGDTTVDIAITEQRRFAIEKSKRVAGRDTSELKNVVIAEFTVPVKPIPTPDLFVGKSKGGEKLDFTADSLRFKLDQNFSEIENVKFKIVRYTAVIEYSNKSEGEDAKIYKKSFSVIGAKMDKRIIEEIRNQSSIGNSGYVSFTLKVESNAGLQNFKSVYFYFE